MERQKAAAQLTETWIRLTGEIYLPEFERVLVAGFAQDIAKEAPWLSESEIMASANFLAQKTVSVMSDKLFAELREWADGFLKRGRSAALQAWNNSARAYGINSTLITSMNRRFREDLMRENQSRLNQVWDVPKSGKKPATLIEKLEDAHKGKEKFIQDALTAIAQIRERGDGHLLKKQAALACQMFPDLKKTDRKRQRSRGAESALSAKLRKYCVTYEQLLNWPEKKLLSGN